MNKKLFLYATEFFAGMSVMAVELGASRLLAPYFSSSQIVWTIIIGTIMIAMALGNIFGGRWVDRDPDPDRIYGRIRFAALWLAAIPVLGKYLILGISALLIFTIQANYLVIAAFASCTVLFVCPLFLLGTITPSLARLTVSGRGDSGRTVGELNACNTIGSIIGTFIPTFVSIPAVGTSVTFLIFAGILLAIFLLYELTPLKPQLKGEADKEASGKINRRKIAVLISILWFLLCCIFGRSRHFAFWNQALALEEESVYNYLQIYETDQEVVLSTNVLIGVQSVYEKEKTLTGMYYDYAMAAPYMAGIYQKERPLDVLILGMGTGTYATQCRRYFEQLNLTGVEIDGKITRLAHEWFELPEDIPVTEYDGRAYLAALDRMRDGGEGMYDVILVDAYQDITIPFQMSSVEFFTLVKNQLRPDGVMVVNLNMRSGREGDINQYLADTIGAVFDEVISIDVAGSTNRELFASSQKGLLGRMEENLALETDEELLQFMQKIYPALEQYQPGQYLLTDDKAPVELLGMQMIDDLIRDEVRYYKRIFQEEGLAGLI